MSPDSYETRTNHQFDSKPEKSRVAGMNETAGNLPAFLPKDESPVEPPKPPTSTPPNGGFQAWLQVLGCFFLWFNSWGLVAAYGVFQDYYAADKLKSHSQQQISWIGSLQAFLLLFGSVASGPIYDMGYFRTCLIVGSTLTVLGMMTTSACSTYAEFILAQGLCTGIGVSFLWTPCVALLTQWFASDRLPLATALAALGSGIGAVIFPIIVQAIEVQVGLSWAIRILTFIQLFTLAIAVCVCRTRVKPSNVRALFDLDAFHEPAYNFYTMGAFVALLGFYTPYIFVGQYAVDVHAADQSLAFYIISIINAGSTLGRTIPSIIGMKIGIYNAWIIAMAASGAFAFGLMGTKSLAGIVAVSFFYGFFCSSFPAIGPQVGVMLSVHKPQLIGTRLGQAFALSAAALLIGPPVAATLVDHYGYHAAFAWSGASALGGVVLEITARVIFGGPKVLKKV